MIDQMKRKHEEQLKKVQRLKKNLKEDHPKEIRERTKRKDNKVNSTLSRINARQHVQVLSNQASEDVTETHRNSSRGGQSEPLKSEWK